ncbi:hypothetical protein GF324_06510 [bacterium]|nr:hypothetical protein [bacterium]
MTVLDWILTAALVGFFIRGLFRGFFVELAELAALAAGYFAARFLSPVGGRMLLEQWPSLPPWLAGVLATVVLFLLAAGLVHLIAILLTKMAKAVGLGALQRVLGGLFGATKIAAVILALLLLIAFTPLAEPVGDYMYKGKVSRLAWKSAVGVRDGIGLDPWQPPTVRLPRLAPELKDFFDSLGFPRKLNAAIEKQEDFRNAVEQTAPYDWLASFTAKAGETAATGMEGMPELPKLDREMTNYLTDIAKDGGRRVSKRAEEFWEALRAYVEEQSP